MKVLHLFSDSQWSGPAAQIVNLCRTLQDQGVDITLACAEGLWGIESRVGEQAGEMGLRTVSLFRLRQHFGAAHDVHEVRLLRKHIDSQKIDLVHAHTDADHLLGGFAARHSKRFPLVVRTSYITNGMTRGSRNRILVARYTDGLITCSPRARARAIAGFALPAERVWTVYGAVDTYRFSARPELPDIRSLLRLSGDHFVLGVAPRPQGDPTCDRLLQALARASKQVGGLRAMIMARGTNAERVVVRPPGTLSMESCVAVPGRLDGDAYVAAVNALDARLFLPPATHDTCTALLEAMALEKPCIVPDRGVPPAIVRQGASGLVVRDDSIAIAGAIVRLADSPRLRHNLGVNARETVVRRFSLHSQGSLVEQVYRSLIALGPRKARLRSSHTRHPSRT